MRGEKETDTHRRHDFITIVSGARSHRVRYIYSILCGINNKYIMRFDGRNVLDLSGGRSKY